MFRLSKHRSERAGERVEFKFSNLQAFKVPKGWDKLYISVMSMETGKTIAKSSKATVRSGTCQWTDSFSESISLSQNSGSKDHEECFFKFVLSMGSAGKPGILGELVLNLASYIDSNDSNPLTLSLNKCNYGTILQVKIQCFHPRTRFRDSNALKATNSRFESPNTSNGDIDNKSDASNTTNNESLGSLSSHRTPATILNRPINQDAISLASGSHSSSDSTENSLGRTKYSSPKTNVNGNLHIRRQDSNGSHASATSSAGPVEDLSRSNPSSFNSRASGSSTPHQWQEATVQAVPQGYAALSLGTSESSKELLEAAEETIDELRDEAKMWERHAQKLKIELEKLKKDFSFKAKQQTELDVELSATNIERDSLKREVDQLKLSLDGFKGSQEGMENCKTEGILNAQRQLEEELKFLREFNGTLTMQLNKSQEANLELVAILEELEETVEKQRFELAKFTQMTSIYSEEMRDQTLMDIEAEHSNKLSAKEESSVLVESLHRVQNALQPIEIVSNQGDSDLMQEIEDLRAKIQELERDCTELTEENLNLIYKLKDSKKDVDDAKESSNVSSFNETNGTSLLDSSVSDISQLKFQISQLEEELHRRDMTEAISTGLFQMDVPKKKCSELETELQYNKNNSIDKEYSAAVTVQMVEIVKSNINLEMPRILHEIDQQLQLALSYVRNLNNGQKTVAERYNEIRSEFIVSRKTNSANQEELIEDMLMGFIKLCSSLQAKVAECKELMQIKVEGIMEKKLDTATDVHIIEDDIMEVQSKDLIEELKLRNEELEAAFLLKEKEIDALETSMKELEDMVSSIKREKIQVEETLAVAQRENLVVSKHLDDVRTEIVLSNDLKTHDKMIERKISELDIGKQEQDLHISEMEVENLHLSRNIFELETQLRHMKDEIEANRFEIEDYKSHIEDLKDEIVQEQAEIENLKFEHSKKLQEVEKQLFDEQEESEVLKKSHSKLQTAIENLIEECSLLQKQNGSFQRQKLEMCELMSHYELESEDLQKKIVENLNKYEVLEEKITLLHCDFTLKEETLTSQLESILQESREQEQKISKVDVFLKHINQEHMAEIRNLKQEKLQLSTQVCSFLDEREKLSSDAVREVAILRSDKNKLEDSFEEVQLKLKLYESEVHNLTQESANKVEGLVNLLNASKQSEEMLMSDIEHMQRMTESLKSSESTFKRLANELELKLKASDYENQQLNEDVSDLKIQLLKFSQFQNEILNLKTSLEEEKYEREKLEGLLLSTSEECNDLKVEKMVFSDKISYLQKALHDAEDDRRSKVALEEKLLRLEADLTTTEASYAQEDGIKNEINSIKKVNSEYWQKIQNLEEEKSEIKKKAQALEKELAQRKIARVEEKVSVKVENALHGRMKGAQIQKEAALESKIHSLQTELTEALEANNIYQIQVNGILSEKQRNKTENSEKVASLETELKEMRERYLHMSLQYAEVEAQREELVMQLKSAAKKEKKWFS